MKKVLQIFFFFLTLLSLFIFYQIFLKDTKKSDHSNKKDKELLLDNNASNLIEKLDYEVQLEDGNYYLVTSESSEINYQNSYHMVKMVKVNATFVDKKGKKVNITSDEALYNNLNHNTNFYKNVVIKYLDNIITSNKVDLDFSKKILLIYENVKFSNSQTILKSDNIKLNLMTKKINIYMNTGKNVKIKINQ